MYKNVVQSCCAVSSQTIKNLNCRASQLSPTVQVQEGFHIFWSMTMSILSNSTNKATLAIGLPNIKRLEHVILCHYFQLFLIVIITSKLLFASL